MLQKLFCLAVIGVALAGCAAQHDKQFAQAAQYSTGKGKVAPAALTAADKQQCEDYINNMSKRGRYKLDEAFAFDEYYTSYLSANILDRNKAKNGKKKKKKITEQDKKNQELAQKVVVFNTKASVLDAQEKKEGYCIYKLNTGDRLQFARSCGFGFPETCTI